MDLFHIFTFQYKYWSVNDKPISFTVNNIVNKLMFHIQYRMANIVMKIVNKASRYGLFQIYVQLFLIKFPLYILNIGSIILNISPIII